MKRDRKIVDLARLTRTDCLETPVKSVTKKAESPHLISNVPSCHLVYLDLEVALKLAFTKPSHKYVEQLGYCPQRQYGTALELLNTLRKLGGMQVMPVYLTEVDELNESCALIKSEVYGIGELYHIYNLTNDRYGKEKCLAIWRALPIFIKN